MGRLFIQVARLLPFGGAPGTQPGELQVAILLQEMLVADGDLDWSECA